MRSYIIVSSMAAAVAAQTAGYHAINLPGMNENVPACTKYTIKWTPSVDTTLAGPVTFGLIGGATQQTLVPIGDNFGSAEGSAGAYEWDVPCDAGADAIYGLKIFLASDTSVFQYSMPFHITPKEGGEEPTETEGPTETETDVPTETETEGPEETEDCDEDEDEEEHPTYYTTPCNTTMIPVPTGEPGYNGSVTTHMPTSAIITSYTTEEGGAEPTETATELPTAGASRAVSGSVAVIAVAAAFLAL